MRKNTPPAGRAARNRCRPVAPAELVATIYRSLGIDPAQSVATGDGATLALVEDARPIEEAFT